MNFIRKNVFAKNSNKGCMESKHFIIYWIIQFLLYNFNVTQHWSVNIYNMPIVIFSKVNSLELLYIMKWNYVCITRPNYSGERRATTDRVQRYCK